METHKDCPTHPKTRTQRHNRKETNTHTLIGPAQFWARNTHARSIQGSEKHSLIGRTILGQAGYWHYVAELSLRMPLLLLLVLPQLLRLMLMRLLGSNGSQQIGVILGEP